MGRGMSHRDDQVHECTGGYRRKFAALNRCPCPYRKPYPAILVMQSAEDRPRSELTEPLDGAARRPTGAIATSPASATLGYPLSHPEGAPCRAAVASSWSQP